MLNKYYYYVIIYVRHPYKTLKMSGDILFDIVLYLYCLFYY